MSAWQLSGTTGLRGSALRPRRTRCTRSPVVPHVDVADRDCLAREYRHHQLVVNRVGDVHRSPPSLLQPGSTIRMPTAISSSHLACFILRLPILFVGLLDAPCCEAATRTICRHVSTRSGLADQSSGFGSLYVPYPAPRTLERTSSGIAAPDVPTRASQGPGQWFTRKVTFYIHIWKCTNCATDLARSESPCRATCACWLMRIRSQLERPGSMGTVADGSSIGPGCRPREQSKIESPKGDTRMAQETLGPAARVTSMAGATVGKPGRSISGFPQGATGAGTHPRTSAVSPAVTPVMTAHVTAAVSRAVTSAVTADLTAALSPRVTLAVTSAVSQVVSAAVSAAVSRALTADLTPRLSLAVYPAVNTRLSSALTADVTARFTAGVTPGVTPPFRTRLQGRMQVDAGHLQSSEPPRQLIL